MSSLFLKLEKEVGKLAPKLRQWRRIFHQYPETGWCEYITTYTIYQQLKTLSSFTLYFGEEVTASSARMGLPAEEEERHFFQRAKAFGVPGEFLAKITGGRTGLVAVIDTMRPGKHLTLRFDIDALPICESSHPDHLPVKQRFASKHQGTMHACGHDGHTAVGIGVAYLLDKFRDELSGKVTLIFQPAEEGSRGAKAIVEKGWLEGVDLFACGHIGISSQPVGTIAAATNRMLATTKMDVVFSGKAAHAGINPHEGKNALLAAAAAALHLHSIPSRPEGMTRLNVGTLTAGRGRNIVPGNAKLEMETRGETAALNQCVVDDAIRMIEAAGQLYDVKTGITVVGEGISCCCDESWAAAISSICRGSKFCHEIIDCLSFGGSEDASLMMKRVQEQGGKATYMVFGSPLLFSHHHERFDFSEETLTVATAVFSRIAFREYAPR
ncbi:aminobenzoyl-glutamate utilization protein A [Evansella caseinilytica]|uniref:Aminobenzoyl-glutamate utilization protein A n=1 Tax=Evansella caseinilytica TaxID=1503961 RepID=A0A1H3H295_9BACI|nr:amidohydrolase [Evansella caseinilytica]SDY08894.1 aminobenzoyl-glutamate utilization protein A [Evansella caseinilytica]